jgi:predicted permease
MMTGLGTDLRYVLRVLAGSPSFTAVAVLSLSLGIGANAAIFSVVRDLLLDPMPVRAPHELRLISWTQPARAAISQVSSGGRTDPETGASLRTNYSYAIYRALVDAAEGTGIEVAGFNFIREIGAAFDGRPPLIVGGALADGRYFRTLGAPMAIGRPLDESDDQPGAAPVAVLGYAFWQRALGGDPAVLGRTIRLSGQPFQIIGVSGQGFRGLSRGGFFPQTDVTVPLSAQPIVTPQWAPAGGSLLGANTVYWVRALARVPPAVSSTPLEARMTAQLRALLPQEALATETPPTIRFVPGGQGEQSVRPESRRLLLILTAVVAVVLLIACVNLAGLMLARGVARQRELAMRRALGASRPRLARQLLLEGLVLALAGATGGLVLTLWSGGLLTTLLTAGLGASFLGTLPMEVRIDGWLVAQTAGVASIAAILFSLLPGLRLTRVDPGTHLKHRAAGASSPKLTLGRLLMALQIAVSIPLVVGAALFLRTVANLNRVDLGFDPQNLVYFRLNPAYSGPTPGRYAGIYLEVLQRLRAIPGVVSATLIENALLSGIESNNEMTVDGVRTSVLMNAVGPGFFETMGMRLISGRGPDERDIAGRPNVGVMNEAAVQRLFGGASPVGRTVRMGNRDVEIVGVVSDSRYQRARTAVAPVLFDSALQRDGFGGHHVALRTRVPPASLETAIREAVAGVHPDLPVPDLRTQISQMEATTARERVFAQLLTVFGGFALLLAGIGLYGVTSYSVARRTTEIGVRVALGARPTQILWLALRQVIVLAAAGLLIGVPLSVLAAPAVSALLYGVGSTDATLIAISGGVMLAFAIGAGLVPALRAMRLDPLAALRRE